jgi:hypothetical protein
VASSVETSVDMAQLLQGIQMAGHFGWRKLSTGQLWVLDGGGEGAATVKTRQPRLIQSHRNSKWHRHGESIVYSKTGR